MVGTDLKKAAEITISRVLPAPGQGTGRETAPGPGTGRENSAAHGQPGMSS